MPDAVASHLVDQVTVGRPGPISGHKSRARHSLAMIKRRIRASTLIKIGCQLRQVCLELAEIVECCDRYIAALMAFGIVAVVVDDMATDRVVVRIHCRHDQTLRDTSCHPVETRRRW